MKKNFKKIIAWVLTLAMCISYMPATAFAEPQIDEIALDSSCIEDVPEGDYVYLGTVSATVNEGDSIYSTKVYRTGNLEKSASLLIKSVDISATYGKDYEFEAKDVLNVSDGKTLIEKNHENSQVIDINEDTAAEVDEMVNDIIDINELDSDEGLGLKQALVNFAGISESEEVDFSAAVNLTFEPGEDSKELKFRVKDDGKAEGQEAFVLMADSPENVEIYGEKTLSVVILDDEPKEKSKVGFTKTKYNAKNGQAVLTVKRSGADYSVCDMSVKTASGTAVAGEDYEEVITTLMFEPYEMEKEVTVDVHGEGSFEVLLDDFRACEGKKTTAEVSIVNNSAKSKNNSQTVSLSGIKDSEDDIEVVLSSDKTSDKGSSAAAEKTGEKSEDQAASAGKMSDVKAAAPKGEKSENKGSDSDEQESEATVTLSEDKNAGGGPALASEGDDKTYSFSISMNGKSYTVESSDSDPDIAKIMDNSYSPALQVGEYIFPKTFSYGHHSGDGYTYGDCKYDGSPGYGSKKGIIEWYDWRTWREGSSYAYSQDYLYPSVFYQSYMPDWQSRSNFGGGQQFDFFVQTTGNNSKSIRKTKDGIGSFSRKIATDYKIWSEPDFENRNVRFQVAAVDHASGRTPKSYMSFYGIVAMNKRYRVNVGDYPKLSYKTADGGTITSEPFRVQLKSGARQLDGTSDHIIYLNRDANASNLVFSTYDINLNGHSGKYGDIVGYDIAVNPADGTNKFTLSYPDDFVNYINQQKKNGMASGSYIDYSAAAVDAEISKIKNSMDTIPYDAYFADWITNSASSRNKYAPVEVSGEREIILEFKPKFQLSPVSIEVREPSYGSGHFTDSSLKVGNVTGFNAGDEISLKCEATGDNQIAEGYEVSTDGGRTYNTILSTDRLFLEKNTSYVIRPHITDVYNCVEIRFESEEAEELVEVANLMPANKANEVEQFKGKNILVLNPSTNPDISAIALARPATGSDYLIDLTINEQPSDPDYVYRPTVKLSSNNKTYNTCLMPFIANKDFRDNVVTIGLEKVKKSDLGTVRLSSQILTKQKPIRETGVVAKDVPVSGYSVLIGTSQSFNDGKAQINAVSAITDTTGSYCLDGVTVKKGDLVPMLVSNGMSAGQVIEYAVTENSGEVRLSAGYVEYPYDAPKVTSIMYRYDNEEHNREHDINSNTVNIYDDSLILTATVDKKGREVEKLVYTVTTVTGMTTTYEAFEEENNPGIYTVRIEGMTKNLFSGDSLSVRVIDKEKRKMDVNGTTTTVPIEYPSIDTGLKFYLENMPVVPQDYTNDQGPEVDIPIIGTAAAKATSGLITFDKTYWDTNHSGYTISVNVGIGYNTLSLKKDKLDKFQKTVKDAKGEMGKAEQIIFENLDDSSSNGPSESSESDESIFSDLESELAASEHNLEAKDPNAAKNSMAELNKFDWSIDIVVLLALNFIYSPEDDEFIYACGSVAVGGTFTCSYTMYTIISACPCYLNISGTLQVDSVVDYTRKEGVEALSAGAFSKYSGNIANVLAQQGSSSHTTIMLSGKAGVGAGLNGVLGAGGYVNLAIQFLVTDKRNAEVSSAELGGALVSAGGAIKIDLFVTSIDVKVANFSVGTGAYEGKSGFDFFGGLAGADKAMVGEAKYSYSTGDGNVLKSTKDGETISSRQYNSGDSNMNHFGNVNDTVNSKDSLMEASVLQSNAADLARPQLLNLSDGRKFLLFLGSDGSETIDSMTLYYTIKEDEEWSKPAKVIEDGTLDVMPRAVEYKGKVYITWLNAADTIPEDAEELEILKMLEQNFAEYDLESGKIREIGKADLAMASSDNPDRHIHMPAQLSVHDGQLYCSTPYISANDLDRVDEIITKGMDFEIERVNAFDLNKESEKLAAESVKIQNKEDNSCVLSWVDTLMDIDGDTYQVSAYVMNDDMGNVMNNVGNIMYLKISNLTKGVDYYPVAVTGKNDSPSSLAFSDVDGDMLLTYLNNGYMFETLDLSDVLGDLFREGCVDAYGSDAADPNWYVKTANELGMEDEEYADSVNEQIAKGKWKTIGANLKHNEKLMTAISDYTTCVFDNDLYIFYTDYAPTDNGSITNGKELYAVCFNRTKDDGEGNGSGQSEESRNDEENRFMNWEFSKPVQLTNYGAVIDELSVYIDEDKTVHGVADLYYEDVDYSGNILTSENSIVELTYKIDDEIVIPNDKVDFTFNADETAVITFDAMNKGLETADGFKYSVSDGGLFGKIESGKIDTVLGSNEKTTVSVPWKLPGNLENKEIEIKLETLDGEHVYKTKVKVPYAHNVVTSDAKIAKDEDGYVMTATVTNYGNKTAPASQMVLKRIDENMGVLEEYGTFDIPSLAPSESAEVEIRFDITEDDYNDIGMVTFLAGNTAYADGQNDIMFRYAAVQPEKVVVNDGQDSMKVKKGESAKITSKVYPHASAAGDPVYTSSDQSVVTVDADGNMTAVAPGKAEITVTYPKWGISKTITVTVKNAHDGGGGSEDSDKHEIAVVDGVKNGSISVDSKSAEKGTLVTVTAVPDEGYKTDKVIVTDDKGNAYEVKDNGDGTYQFKMPGVPVKISAVFTEDSGSDHEKTCPSKKFTDLNLSAWYHEATDYVISRGRMNGVGEKTFAPNGDVTRAMFVTVIHRLEGEPDPENGKDFDDVSQDAYYADAVKWANAKGIVKGISDTEFAPDAKITREQMAAILYRYAQYKGMAVDEIIDENAVFDFEDAEDISEYAVSALNYCISVELINGMGDGTLSPKSNATRAQMAAILMRVDVII